VTWNWAQGVGGGNHTYQFIRGGTLGGGDLFAELPEGRALVLATAPEPSASSAFASALGALGFVRRRARAGHRKNPRREKTR